jgi:hypothetical protein
VLLRNIHLWIKTGTTQTQKRQETDYPFRISSILSCSVIKFLEPRVSQFWAMKETNIKNLCYSQIIKYFCATQKSLLLFRAAHRNKQKYFDTFALLWDDTKRSNCPERAGFAKARYMKSFSISFCQIFFLTVTTCATEDRGDGVVSLKKNGSSSFLDCNVEDGPSFSQRSIWAEKAK